MGEAPEARLNYVELQAADTAESKRFYENAFGWSLTDFGPIYSSTTSGDTDIGLDGDKKGPPLPVISTGDLEAALARVEAAGGVVTKPIFSFPGGRRFHFTDPAGNELAVWQQTDE